MTKSRENLYIQISDSSAIRAIKARRRAQGWKDKIARLVKKYTWVDTQPFGSKFIYLVAIVAHIFAAILAGMNMGPILFSVHTNIFGDSTWAEIAKSVLPIGMLYFMSLIIGVLCSKIRAEADPIIPHKYNFNHLALVKMVGIIVIYFGFLLHIIKIGTIKIGTEDQLSQLVVTSIIWLSLIELIIGFFAHHGWTIASYQFRLWWARKRLLAAENKYFKVQQKCERYYQYYLQSSKPDDIYMTKNIEEILQSKLDEDA